MSNIRTQNNKNCNNQTATSVPTEQVSTKNFFYEALIPNQVAALHQEK
jgi:hypothetical protein